MNNDDVIADLKQFIAATVSQAIAPLDEKVTSLDQKVTSLDEKVTSLDQKVTSLDEKVTSLSQEMRDGFAGVADAMEPTHATLDDYETRLTKLEQQTV